MNDELGLPTEQYQDVTRQKKSDVHMNDEPLLNLWWFPDLQLPDEADFKVKQDYTDSDKVWEVQMNTGHFRPTQFPTSHPCQTQSSKYTRFPNSRSPEDCDTGIDASSHQLLHPNIPTKAEDVVVLRKTRGRVPMNPLILDNYYMKAVGKLTGELGEDVELKETFLLSLSQVRPLEGCTICLLQGQYPYESILQEQCSDASVFIQGFYCHSWLLRHNAE
ncbi:sperm-associated microtubule inner protein 4 [Guaruba guarouba]